jgi:hypothetical protein
VHASGPGTEELVVVYDLYWLNFNEEFGGCAVGSQTPVAYDKYPVVFVASLP